MRFVEINRSYYCGIDLHSKSLVLCVINDTGKILLTRTIPNSIQLLKQVLEPYKHSLAIGVESTYNWYWLIDGCREHGFDIYLGHTHYMKIISAGKTKSDKIDARKIANLLRAGFFPLAHAAKPDKRCIRDTVRHRMRLVQIRALLLGHTKMTCQQHGLIDLPANALRSTKQRNTVVDRLPYEYAQFSMSVSSEIISDFDLKIKQVEDTLLKHTNDYYEEDITILRSIPGVGPILGMTILYETDTLTRFRRRQNYTSYCRLTQPYHSSNEKNVGKGNAKCGNPYLKWAYMEIITVAVRSNPEIRIVSDYLNQKYPALKARAMMANHFCTAIYYMLKNKTEFDVQMFVNGLYTPEAQSLETRLV